MTSSCHTCSVINGTRGASSCVRVTRHSCKVAKAATSPSQKRRRERRTYQFDKSSMNFANSRPATCESKPSSALSTFAIKRLSSEIIHLSINGLSASDGVCESSKLEAFAYKAWNETVFQYVNKVLRTTSFKFSCPTRLADQGEPAASMYQRTASAPC